MVDTHLVCGPQPHQKTHISMSKVFISNNDTRANASGTSGGCNRPDLQQQQDFFYEIYIGESPCGPCEVNYKSQPFDCQFGLSDVAMSTFKNRMISLGITASIESLMENSMMCMLALSDSSSTKQFFSILFLYFKTISTKSVARLACDYAARIFSVSKMDSQSGVYGTDLEYPPWLKALKELSVNWKLALTSEMFVKIGRLLAMCVAIGLCGEMKLNPTIAGLDLFTMPEIPKKVSAVSLVDAVFDLVVYFCEGGYVCFVTGSISPLLYGSIDSQRLSDMYMKCKRWAALNLTGQLATEKADQLDYARLLQETKELCKRLKQGTRGASERQVFQHYLERLDTWEAELTETRMGGGSRIRPICIYLYGPSSVGKSTCVPGIMTTLLKSNGYHCTSANICSIADQDKYMSSVTGFTTGIVLDDVNNIKAEFQSDSSLNKIVVLNNNNKTYAIKAGVEEKGKVPLCPMVVLATSNTKDGGAHAFSNEPLSWVRRYDIIITFRVKAEYSLNGMLDQRKANRDFPDAIFPDIYDLKLEEGISREAPKEGEAADVAYRILVHNGRSMENVSYPDAMRCLVDLSKEHFEHQTRVVERSNNLHERILFCKECSYPTEVCSCVSCAKVVPPVADVDPPPVAIPSYVEAKSTEGASISFTADPASDAAGDDSGYNGDASVESDPYAGLTDAELDELYPPYADPIMDSQAIWSKRKYYVPVLFPDHTYSHSGECSFFRKTYAYSGMVYHNGYEAIGNALATGLDKIATRVNTRYAPAVIGNIAKLEEASTKVVMARLDQLTSSPLAQISTWIPSWAMDKEDGKNLIYALNHVTIRKRIRQRYAWSTIMAVLPLFILRLLLSAGICVYAPLLLMWYLYTHNIYRDAVKKEQKILLDEVIENRKKYDDTLFARIRDNHLHWIMGTSVAIAGLYAVIKTYRSLYPLQEQGALSPTSIEEIDKRDAEKNPWVPVATIPIETPAISQHTAASDLERMVSANTLYMEVKDGTRLMHCNAVALCSNLLLIPKHFWDNAGQEFTARFVRREGGTVGSTFKAKLSYSHAYHFPTTDFSLVWVPSAGTWKDITPYIALELRPITPGTLMYRSSSGEIKTSKLSMASQNVTTMAGTFPGGLYTLDWPTFNGLCMATIVSDDRAPSIIGFHLGGKEGSNTGCSGFITNQMVQEAISEVKQLPGVLVTKNHVPPDTEQFGVQFFTSPEVSTKSAVNYLTGEPVIQVYGQCIGRATMKSEVIESPLSPHVSEVCKIPQQWGPPKLREDFPFQRTLIHSAEPAIGFEGDVLIKAVECYSAQLGQILERVPHLKASTKPLTEQQTISGIDGKRFMDAMKKNSAIGFPLTGPKSRYMTELPPTEEHRAPFAFEDRFWIAYDEVRRKFRRGERACLIFKACLKDTPTKLDSDKVRKFDAGHICLQFGMRMYYLPVARAMSLFPLISECAVGINSESPEWEEMHFHISKFGKNHILAGDHSKYDARMPAQLICAAFRILIDFAKKCDYTEDDICMMEGFATEVVYGYSAFNGELIQFIGSNPSGHGLTVYINSIVNSLMLRAAFYSIYESKSFSANVALMTYGDDCIASVHKSCKAYTHKSVAAYFAKHDMKFTMPDKTSEATEYSTMDNTDFLKRKSFYHPDIKCWVGKLEDSSIFKSLHCQMRSKHVTARQIAAQNIDGALSAWFYHGRDVFELRRAQLSDIADRAEVKHMVLTLNLSYDERVAAWKEKYDEYRISPPSSV